MKQAERLALIVLAILVLITAGLTAAVCVYHTVSLWAGMLAGYAQLLLVLLCWWGLRLGRQQEELAEFGGPGTLAAPVATSATMQGLSPATYDNPAFAGRAKQDDTELRTLETGFQRVVTVLAAAALLVLAAVVAYLIYGNIQGAKPGAPLPVSPVELNNGALVAAIGVLLGYIMLFTTTRVTRQTQGTGEAVHGIITMALPGAAAVAAAVVLGYFKVSYAGEVAAGVVGLFLLLQALELLFNAFRSYEGVEEFDQEAVDLQALPLVPMFSSQWILGLRLLLAQSLGLAVARDGAPGVVARVMPRVLIAVAVVLVAVSMLRVVPQGTAAIRERFGYASDEDISHPLAPGLHVLAPWPIDKLVVIPTARLQQLTVGADDALPVVNGKAVDFVLWTDPHTEGAQEEGLYLTGERYMLGGYVGIWWRVRNASDFYRHVSHSDFYAGSSEDGEAQGRPIYELLVRENAICSIIHTVGTHALDEIMSEGRGAVQEDCRRYLQARLDNLGVDAAGQPISSGIEIVDLTIKDVHPPQGVNETETAGGKVMGPARAYEFVVESREYRETMINNGMTVKLAKQNQAIGESAAIISRADGDAAERVNKALGETAYLKAVAPELDRHEAVAQGRFYYQAMEAVLAKVNKIFVGLSVKRPNMIQAGAAGTSGVVVPPPAPPGR